MAPPRPTSSHLPSVLCRNVSNALAPLPEARIRQGPGMIIVPSRIQARQLKFRKGSEAGEGAIPCSSCERGTTAASSRNPGKCWSRPKPADSSSSDRNCVTRAVLAPGPIRRTNLKSTCYPFHPIRHSCLQRRPRFHRTTLAPDWPRIPWHTSAANVGVHARRRPKVPVQIAGERQWHVANGLFHTHVLEIL